MNPFSQKYRQDIADLSTALKDIENKYPVVLKFLETFCGYNSPVNSNDPYQICYSGGKRDVILTIKTIMSDELTPETIAMYYKQSIQEDL